MYLLKKNSAMHFGERFILSTCFHPEPWIRRFLGFHSASVVSCLLTFVALSLCLADRGIMFSRPWHFQLCLFGWLVADGWCWFVLREEYCWLVLAGCWWLVCSERKVPLAGG
jgi:hypothetical protein